jgi:hypothetical protein
MLVAVHARVLAQIILVLCFAAGMAASCIIFVLYGPVPVRRKVTIVPRLAPPDPFAQNRAAAIISLPAQPPSVQQQVAPGIAFVLPQGSGSHAAPPVAHAASHVAHAHEPPPRPVRPKKSDPRPGTPDVAPLVLRRPRGESPAPLPRNRSARGTERRPRPSELDLDVTAVRARVDHSMSPEDTLDTPLVDPDFIDDQFLEDGR